MGEAFTSWIKIIPPTWQAIGALTSAVALGVAGSLFAMGYVELPDAVRDISADLRETQVQAEANRRDVERVRRELVDEMSRVDERLRRILCHLEETRRESPNWARCEGLLP